MTPTLLKRFIRIAKTILLLILVVPKRENKKNMN
jgi:hypothetical protein